MSDSVVWQFGVTLSCVKCGRPFVTRRRRIYCSSFCRREAARERRLAEGPDERALGPESTPASA